MKTSMILRRPGIKTLCLFCTALLVLVGAVSLFVGKYPLNLRALIAGEGIQRQVFWSLRLSRTMVAVVGGFALGAAGFAFQTVFRNPLASPDIIGVSSGASAGAAAGILLFSGTAAVTISAFTGALLAVGLSLLLSALDRSGKNTSVVLAGIAVHALAQMILMCLKLAADPERELAAIEYWIMGSLNGVTLDASAGNMILCMACILLMLMLHRQIILLSAAEDEARMLGAAVGRLRLTVLTIATLAVSAVVSLTGLVGFVGLLAPHTARILTKSNRAGTMLLSGLLGGVLLCGADILARSAAAVELPVSIFTSLLGAPLLVFLAAGRRNAG